jgi:hypothetical protein
MVMGPAVTNEYQGNAFVPLRRLLNSWGADSPFARQALVGAKIQRKETMAREQTIDQ